MHHDHSHHHGQHHHVPENFDNAFKIGIALNTLYVLIETGFGIAYNSVALLSDAGHNVSDILALVLAWGASWLSHAQPTERRTYGLKRATVLASLISGVALCMALGVIVWESIGRLSEPAVVSGMTVMIVAGVGVFINGVTAWMFMRGQHRDLNIRGAYLHMAGDAAVSFAVVVAGGVIYFTGWYLIDPILALLVAIIILISGFGLLRDSLDLAMDAVPKNIDIKKVQDLLCAQPNVVDVHHLHIWGMSTTEVALTVHLVVDDRCDNNALIESVGEQLAAQFSINHPTIQIEHSESAAGCASGESHVH